MSDWVHDTESWGLILGVVTPLAVAVVQQPTWSKPARWAVGWVGAIIVGILTCLANGTLDDGATVLRTLAIVIATTQATYGGWRNAVAPAIEYATSRHAKTTDARNVPRV